MVGTVSRGSEEPGSWPGAGDGVAQLGAESTVLVNGAAGGVGHLALQLAKRKVAGPRHRRGLGRPRDVPRAGLRRGPGSRRFLRTVKRGGALYPVYFGDFDDAENERPAVTVTATQVRSNGARLAELGRQPAAGTVRVTTDSTFALADARAAHERAARGHIRGKIVLTVAQDS